MKNKLLKTVLILFLLFHVPSVAMASFLYDDVVVLEKDKIAALSDEELLDHYLDIAVDLEAMKTFYFRAGFTPNEYKSFKSLLKYRVDLLMEMQKRKMEIPRLS